MNHSDTQASIVLVHGAFVDGSCWQAVHAILSRRGHEVLIVQNPTLTLDGDVAATGRMIGRARHPVVLAGHGYGGAVITEAGDHPKVRALVYLAAFVPDEGESVESLTGHAAGYGDIKAPLLPSPDGFLIIDPEQFPYAFGADVAMEQTRFMAAAQVPWGVDAATARLRRTAWRSKPAYYLVATADRMILPGAQRRMAQWIGAQVSEIDSSHALMLARPSEVAALIEMAAAVPL